MPLALYEALERTATVDVFREIQHTGMKPGDLLVTYRVISDTALDDDARLSKALQEAEDNPDRQTEIYAELILKSVIKWDLSLTAGGETLPLDLETLRTIKGGGDIYSDIIDAVAAHKRPGKKGSKK